MTQLGGVCWLIDSLAAGWIFPASVSAGFLFLNQPDENERLLFPADLFNYFSALGEDNVAKPHLSRVGFSHPRQPALTPPRLSPAAIPSAPRNVISSVNETSLSLEWDEPEDSGGRSDLVYNVVCKKCLRDRSPCTRCDDNVDIAPRRLGLRQRKVVVRNLQAHTRYSFEVQAVNGVSGKKAASPSFSTVNITTNQAGEEMIRRPLHRRRSSDR